MGIFYNAIKGKREISVISEIKRASPSYGKFPQHAVKMLIGTYEKGGASAISVVTEGKLFSGSIELLKKARKYTNLPILRKDFITEISQIDETAQTGANAVLLIARILEKDKLQNLVQYARGKNIDPVIEIHDDEDLKKIEGMQNAIIGINNRNLKTFETDVKHAEKLLNKIPASCTIIAESAFSKPEEFAPYLGKIDAVLIGTALLISKNPYKTLISFTSYAYSTQ